MTNAFMLIIASFVLLPALSGCVASAENASNRDIVASSQLLRGDARLRPGDRVQVTVFGEDGLTGA
jgi:protein involved in polysaccharide export with SLBB domain